MQQSTKRSFVLPVYGYEERDKAELAQQVRRALRKHLAERSLDFDPEEIEELFDSPLFSESLQRIPVPERLKRAS